MGEIANPPSIAPLAFFPMEEVLTLDFFLIVTFEILEGTCSIEEVL